VAQPRHADPPPGGAGRDRGDAGAALRPAQVRTQPGRSAHRSAAPSDILP
jgi:hypothetical protein